jgi:hypothetical protein
MDLDAYRHSAETFISELTGAYYRHYAGLEAEYEIEPIYARHAGLFTRDAVARLRDRVDAAPTETDQQRRARMLLDFAVEGTVGQATKALDAELARRGHTALLPRPRSGRLVSRPAARVEPDRDPARTRDRSLTASRVTLGIERRPRKSPRAFCAPVRVPGEIYLVLAPVGGRDDYGVLFHESGHTEHYAHVDPSLPFEFRYLGDNGITEAYAFLLQHLVENPHWLQRRLRIEDPSEIVSHARAKRLIYLRRYAAKLVYESELHGAQRPLHELRHRYAQLLGDALQGN